MSIWTLLVTSWVVGFSGAAAPGPLLVACVTHSVRSGFRGGLLTVAGHAAMEFLAVLGLAFGLGTFLIRPEISLFVSLIGGLVLVWLGLGTARAALRGDVSLPHPEQGGLDQTPTGLSDTPALMAGVSATVSGPYWILWWATVGLSYLTLAEPLGAAGTAAFYLGHIGADFVWYAVVAAAVAGGRRLLSDHGYRVLLAACGLCLVILGVFFGGRSLLALF